jgi:DNA invertase Pin-like site-specific DNA recombinase
MIRVSTPGQAEEDSSGIGAQLQSIERAQKLYELQVKWRIQIDGVSGASVRLAPGSRELMRICQKW